MLDSIISENVVDVVDGACKIESNQDKSLTNNQEFVEETQDDSLGRTFNPLVRQSKLLLFPKVRKHQNAVLINYKPLKDR